ncbi:MAG: carbon-nitrogen hydrolase family protein [Deltaproteobacteria bacterium]|nr:carbon-nitrogen hydrolase family protein [Deltaproteobacteria bacterium]MBI2532999.1 carbon-nitrogen hydrolase family protein [Deltaproteobacteria bacterium]MBI3064440.1 carbon-nitrogen hydrolase family protein [Deltaproteobacteria bacterium]
MHKIAIAQISSSTEKAENLKAALFLTQEARAKGAQLIAFPEFLMAFSPASQTAEELAALAESVDGSFVTAFRDAARAARIGILATIYERCSSSNRVYDTAVWIDNEGGIAAVYRKLHLYDAFGFKESDKFLAGDDIAPLVTNGDARIGIMICYDLRFPEMARMLSLAGANVMIAPSGWVQGDLKVEHWQTMIKARALENGCYVIAPNQAGNIYTGHSMVVDPLGRVLADMGEREGIEIVELDLALVNETRQKLPLLKNRRTEVYQKHFRS